MLQKEASVLVHGCKKFRFFIYGRLMLAETDHKPLIAIVTKGLATIAPRNAEIIFSVRNV